MRSFPAARGKNRSQAFATGGGGFVARAFLPARMDRGLAGGQRRGPRTVMKTVLNPSSIQLSGEVCLRSSRHGWFFKGVWFKQPGIPEPHRQECLCYNAAQQRREVIEP